MNGIANSRLSTGVQGLDEVLSGGLIRGRAYLVRGGPGCGKTTLGMHFLTTGIKAGESGLYISLGEPEGKLRQNAAASGFNLEGVKFLDLSPPAEFFAEAESYDIFSPAEVELEPTTKRIVEAVESLKPTRVFIDSMTQIRYLSTDAFQFRKQALSFLRFLTDRNATVLFTAEGSSEIPDDDLQFLADGIIHVEFNQQGRTLAVTKFRGSGFRSGEHSMRLGDGGMTVFPHLVPEKIQRDFVSEPMSFGVPEIDELTHGGLERGTTSLITGPTGTGKTTLGLQFIKEAAGRGEHSAVYTFEEGVDTLLNRCGDINIPVRAMVEQGTLSVVQIEPLRYTPDEFARMVRNDVEAKRRRIVMIDSITGYGLCMQGRDFVTHVHGLAAYLRSVGVTVVLINEIDNITGDFRASNDQVSYLADNIIFLRYVEINGELRKAVGVLKKRAGSFEKALREIDITRYGIKVGKPLTGLRGILSGSPELMERPA